MVNTQPGATMPTLSHFLGGAGGLTGTLVHARGQWDCCKSTRCPTFPQHSQTNVLCKESSLMITMSRCRTGSFQGFASFISTPEFINDEAHQSYSYPNLLVNLGIVGLHGDPKFFFFLIVLNLFIYLFIYFWLCWVFVSVRGLSLVAASGGHSSSQCAGLSLSRPLSLWSTGSRRAGSVVVAHGPSCSAGCGIFQDQGSNPCPLHWQADSQPLRHQGSPANIFNNALKHPGAGPSSGSPNPLRRLWKVTERAGTLTHFISPIIVPTIFSSLFTFFHQICWGFFWLFSPVPSWT